MSLFDGICHHLDVFWAALPSVNWMCHPLHQVDYSAEHPDSAGSLQLLTFRKMQCICKNGRRH
jgi:hypothetical protein